MCVHICVTSGSADLNCFLCVHYKQQVGRQCTSPTLVHIIQKPLQDFHSKLNASMVRSFINSLVLVSQNSEVFFLCLQQGKC